MNSHDWVRLLFISSNWDLRLMGRPNSILGSMSRSHLRSTSSTSVALDNLRAIVILIVIAVHSVLAYLQSTPAAGSNFDQPPYDWRSFPIVDSHRFLGFDLFCAWQDVSLMSLLFLLSGLFVWPSLCRKKDWGFLRDRAARLGVPYVFGIAVLIPLAIYPAYAVTAADPSVTAYWHSLVALPYWPNGPLWFIWQLLALNLLAVGLNSIAPDALPALGRWTAEADKNPGRFFGVLLAASAVAYVPLAIAFTPWAWANSGFLGLQFCRPLQYAVYFFAGVGLGAAGIEHGILAHGSVLARRWAFVLAVALIAFFLWLGLTALTMLGGAPAAVGVAADFSFVPACAGGAFFMIAVCLRFATGHSRILGYLAANAYGVYLVHYVFVIWLQFALLPLPLFAVVKATVVFTGTLVLSLVTTAVVQRIPFGARLIGAAPRAMAAS
jgi:peptidoglycan/LPS O-acetylase OafA/YrhL